MAYNKVVYDSTTLIDLTDTTATADTIAQGHGAYGADGVWMDGTLIDGNYIGYGITDTTLPLAGIAVVGQAVLVETAPQTGTAQVGYTVIGG